MRDPQTGEVMLISEEDDRQRQRRLKLVRFILALAGGGIVYWLVRRLFRKKGETWAMEAAARIEEKRAMARGGGMGGMGMGGGYGSSMYGGGGYGGGGCGSGRQGSR